jgi:hypothetical protein
MSEALSSLRQRLHRKLGQIEAILRPAFESDPIFPGNVFLSRHRCGKKACRCMTRGELHETLRLQVRFEDGIANRCLSEEEAVFWRKRTESYKRLREAQRSLRRWEQEVLEILTAIEHLRQSREGLGVQDGKRKLR